jgi:hypothetical protein
MTLLLIVRKFWTYLLKDLPPIKNKWIDTRLMGKIMNRINKGETAVSLAKEYGINRSQIDYFKKQLKKGKFA